MNEFREDLFFRLHVYPIYIPNMNERKEDIVILANHFLQEFSIKQNKKVKNFSEEIIDFIKQYSWKGNIRELVNFVERLVALASDGTTIITSEIFPRDLLSEFIQFRDSRKIESYTEPLKIQVNEYEAKIVKKTLNECNWNKSEAARKLGISEKNIRYKIEKLNIRKHTSN